MNNNIITDLNRSYTKILVILTLLGLTIVSCQDSSTIAPEVEEQVNLEKALSNKLGADRTLKDWGVTKEEFEGAYYAIYNGIIEKTASKSRSLSDLSSVTPPVWESDFGRGVNMGDDDCKDIEIGFPFTFYGKTFTQLWVNSNGNITFDNCNRRFWPTEIPDSGNRVIIAPLYADFDPSHASSSSEIYTNTDVYVNTVGTAPNRTFVATWLDIPAWDWPGPYLPGLTTFQVQLFEGTNSILFGYKELSVTGTNELNGKSMNIGISDGVDRFINSATGEAIPKLDKTNICYKLEDGEYKEIFGACGSAPVADAGPDQTVECAGDITAVTLDGSGSNDPAGEPITYSWSLNGNEIATDATPTINLPMGSHTISLTVTNASGTSTSDEVIVDVVDTTAPELTYTVHTTSLWPPNGDMHLSVSGISAFDVCDTNPSLSVTVIDSANRGESDWDIVENEDGTIDVYLRAQKAGNGNRTYTVVITSSDVSGNLARETVDINVPKNMGGGTRATIGRFRQ